MGLFKKIGKALKKAGNFVGDVGKGIAKNAIAPIESITGRDWNPNYKTKAGRILAVGADKGTNMLHIAPKAFADGITGEKATEWANKLRKKENREKAFGYNEMNFGGSHNSFGVEKLDKGFQKLTAVTAVAGTLYGSKFNTGIGNTGQDARATEQASNQTIPGQTLPTTETKSGGGVLPLVAVAAALILKK